MSMNCDRCGDEVSWRDETITLVGGVVASLCNACRTAWDLVVRNSEFYAMARDNYATKESYISLAYAQQPVSKEQWLALKEKEEIVDKGYYDLGLEFVKPLPEYKDRVESAREVAREIQAARVARKAMIKEKEMSELD